MAATSGRLWRVLWALVWRFLAADAIGWMPFALFLIVMHVGKTALPPPEWLDLPLLVFIGTKSIIEGIISLKWAVSGRNSLGDFRLALLPWPSPAGAQQLVSGVSANPGQRLS